MSLVSSIILLVTVIIVYYILSRLYSTLFRLTGIPKEKSAFQAISLLTNAGYTTGESELIVSEKTRRHIATAAMLTGYFFSVIWYYSHDGGQHGIHRVFCTHTCLFR